MSIVAIDYVLFKCLSRAIVRIPNAICLDNGLQIVKELDDNDTHCRYLNVT